MRTSIRREKRPPQDGVWDRDVWLAGAVIVVLGVLLVAWLLLQPGGTRVTRIVTSAGGVVVPLFALFLCFLGFRAASRTDEVSTTGRRWAPVMLGAGILSYTIGRIAFNYYVWVLDRLPPMPSYATIGFLGQYPLLLAGMVVVMTLSMRKAFVRRTVVELRQEERDEGEQGFFFVTTAGRAGIAGIRLEYPEREKRYEAASGEVPAFSSLRRATFQTRGGTGVLKVWAHRVTPEGNSVALAGLLNVRQGDEIKRYDLRLSDGQVVVPTTQEACRVDITLAEADDADPLARLL